MPATDPIERQESMATPPPKALKLLWHAGDRTDGDELIELGDDAQAKQLLIRETIHWLLQSWPQIKHAAKVSQLAIEVGEKRCRK